MTNQANPVAYHLLELMVRIAPRMWTCCAYSMFQSEGSATDRSLVQRSHTECDVLMSVIRCNNNPLQCRMCRDYTNNV
jgi:hypothetical protein